MSFGIITYPNGFHEIVWLLDSSVKHLSGKHVALFIGASLSEPHINGTAMRELYVCIYNIYGTTGVIKFWGPHENGDPWSPFSL